jgi:3-oxoacyl-[acyl-carrier protein] reductase
MSSLEGKVALITGSGHGIGRADAALMAARGADVIVNDQDGEGAGETAALVEAAGRRAAVIVADITKVAAMKAEIARAEAALGGIDILVNNAGIGGVYPTTPEVTELDFDRMIEVHVKGTFFTTQAVVPGMKARGRGAIVNISSNWGQAGNPVAPHYCAAKAAILGLTKAWAKEFAPWGIRVNAVAPGWVRTGMGDPGEMAAAIAHIPLGREGAPEEIAYAVAFLASDEAAFITGQVLPANGGNTIVGI